MLESVLNFWMSQVLNAYISPYKAWTSGSVLNEDAD